jgi:hypothetical protein
LCRIKQIDRLLKQIGRRFEQVDARLNQPEGRFMQVCERFTRLELNIDEILDLGFGRGARAVRTKP